MSESLNVGCPDYKNCPHCDSFNDLDSEFCWWCYYEFLEVGRVDESEA